MNSESPQERQRPRPGQRPHLSPQQLEARLLDFGSAVCDCTRNTPRDFAATQAAHQLIRAATSPAANYAEARSAPTQREYIHKMHDCLKELRESSVWLRQYQRRTSRRFDWEWLHAECDELIAIFVSSIQTAKRTRVSP
jgi:four helix bundle protein